jgi:hypothetical protein
MGMAVADLGSEGMLCSNSAHAAGAGFGFGPLTCLQETPEHE